MASRSVIRLEPISVPLPDWLRRQSWTGERLVLLAGKQGARLRRVHRVGTTQQAGSRIVDRFVNAGRKLTPFRRRTRPTLRGQFSAVADTAPPRTVAPQASGSGPPGEHFLAMHGRVIPRMCSGSHAMPFAGPN